MTSPMHLWRRWSRRPVAVGLLALVLTSLFVGARLADAAHGKPGAFVLRGSLSAEPAAGQDPRVPVLPGAGYDGQFYYRMALAPTDLATHSHGIVLDDRLRRARIGYPALTHLAALGRARAVPSALIAVNVVAVAVIAWLGALLAVSLGLDALWGLLLAGYGGLVTSVGRDLTEPVELALLTAALLLLVRRRPVAAAAAMTGAVLTRETALLLPAALLLCAAWGCVRDRRRPHRQELLWLVPVAGWAAWEVVCKLVYGQLPITDETGNTGAPFAAFGHAVVRWVSSPDRGRLVFLAEVVSLLVVVGLALVTARRSAPAYLLVGLALALVLVLSLSAGVWNDDPNETRTFADAHLLGAAALLTTTSSRARLVAAVLTGATWLLVVVLRVHQL
jgi:hypothetical protein